MKHFGLKSYCNVTFENGLLKINSVTFPQILKNSKTFVSTLGNSI